MDLHCVTDTEPSANSGIADGEYLLRLTDAVVGADVETLHLLRAEGLERMGNDAVVDAMAVAAGFNGINRVADATGTVLDSHMMTASRDFRESTGINRYLQP